jgi:cytochrome c oxidase subunit 2
MDRTHRPRRLATGLVAICALALAACHTKDYPNSTFNHHTEFNTAIDALWDRLFGLGTAVFIGVESILLYTILKFRRRSEDQAAKHVHGNTTLEIAWTAIPAIILVFIAVPTVKTIFRTQAKAVASALQVEVVGHQWWWEFRYPQYTTRGAGGKVDTLTTANELYLPVGRTVNFALRTDDVLHSFWIPQMGGKRDLIANHINYLWFTPNADLPTEAWNGSCNEYCGASHANMKFRVFTVQPAEFASWVTHQQTAAAFGPSAPAGGDSARRATTVPANTVVASAGSVELSPAQGGSTQPKKNQDTPPTNGGTPVAAPNATTPIQSASLANAGYTFPRERMPKYTVPATPMPDEIIISSGLVGDPARGMAAFNKNYLCGSCHTVNGNPTGVGRIGPNLTHVGSRLTIAGAIYPNDTEHLRRWIKNARLMKPGVKMPTLGTNQLDPQTGQINAAGLSDQDIADIVAYLQSLK